MPKSTLCCYLIFTGSGPILALSTDPKLTDERLVSKLRDKGIDHLMAYQVDLGISANATTMHSRACAETWKASGTCACSTSTATRSWPPSRSTPLGDPIKLGA